MPEQQSTPEDNQPEIQEVADLNLGLAIMGKMAAGKTTASSHLTQRWGGKAWTVAERIKQVAHALVDQNGDLGALLEVVIVQDELLELATRELLRFADWYQPEPGDKPRRLYQEVGQILRDLHPDTKYCWEEDLERRIKAYPSHFTIIDMRAKESFHFFVNERGYDSLLIAAPEEIRKQRLLQRDNHIITDPRLLNHVSETDVDELEFEYVINNIDETPEKLYAELDNMVRQLVERARQQKQETDKP